MKKLMVVAVFLTSLAVGIASPAFAVTLTSLTLEKTTDQGAWTNAPGGIWSTNLADPLSQLGVRQNSVFLNTPGSGLDLGEISIDLEPGLNTFELYGTSHGYGGSEYYGLALFFDHNATPPDAAIYNLNGSNGPFWVTPAGTVISGSANGGLFPDIAPGSSVYHASDGSTVEVVRFNALYDDSNADLVSWGNIGSDGYPDVIAQLVLNYTPATPLPEPADIDIVPDTLNIKSKGKWITCYIELPEDYDLADIDIDSIKLWHGEDSVAAEWGEVQDDVMMIKFDKSAVKDLLETAGEVELIVTGEVDGTNFEGSDTILVINN